MNIIEIIEKKKKKIELTAEEINYVIASYCQEDIADYQMSALLMAIYFNGMSDEETINLTKAMVNSGDVVDLSSILKPTVDKHSTGGVGDKVSLILAPILACFDLAVAKMSGRGLGHTGGTLDKLESIPGFKIEIDDEQFIKIVTEVGMSIIGQTKDLVPADKKLYGLRDVTATVDSIPLIASSIMSKKIASGSQTIILDVKYGDGAFMKNADDAHRLADALVMIGKGFDRRTIAMVTNMSEPLGNMVGNSLEIKEALATLSGNGPADITNLCIEIATEFLLATELYSDATQGKAAVEEVIANGEALAKFKQFVVAQGGNKNFETKLEVASEVTDLKAISSGFIHEIIADQVGICAMHLGAGRLKYTDDIDHSVGIEVLVKVGDAVKKDDCICRIYHHSTQDVDNIINDLQAAITISPLPKAANSIIESVVK